VQPTSGVRAARFIEGGTRVLVIGAEHYARFDAATGACLERVKLSVLARDFLGNSEGGERYAKVVVDARLEEHKLFRTQRGAEAAVCCSIEDRSPLDNDSKSAVFAIGCVIVSFSWHVVPSSVVTEAKVVDSVCNDAIGGKHCAYLMLGNQVDSLVDLRTAKPIARFKMPDNARAVVCGDDQIVLARQSNMLHVFHLHRLLASSSEPNPLLKPSLDLVHQVFIAYRVTSVHMHCQRRT